MKTRVIRSANVLAVALLAAGVAAGQAAQCDAATKAANAGNCPAAAATPPKSTAQRFPFPGEEPSAADKPADMPADAPPADAPPDAPSPSQSKGPRPKPQAYPGDPDAPPADAPAGTGESSSSSSSSSSSGSGDTGDAPASDNSGPLSDAGSTGDNTKAPGHRRKIPKVNPETPESRAANDLTVAEFYQNDGNYKGAYDRAKDAVQFQPDDPYTHFALAEAARKLGKRDEAKSEYEAVLKLDPIPKQLKATQRALAEMASEKK